jgi:dienelactone hydrolase
MGTEFERDAKWAYWPKREDLSAELMKLLVAAQEGGSTVAECLSTAGRIRTADDDSWYREWKKAGDANDERGNTALGCGNSVTAKSNWLRAINYYQASVALCGSLDRRQQVALASARECARKYLQHQSPAGEIVTIPWLSGHPLQGYFLPAGTGRAPAVICIGEPGHRKEEYLFKLARYARDRGLSLLAVDLLGVTQAAGALEEVVARCPDLESAIPHVMDHLAARDDVLGNRIAILADGWGSSFVARGVALDSRFAAAVCDGGIWELHEQMFVAERRVSRGAPIMRSNAIGSDSIAQNIECPVLITLGDHGWLEVHRVIEMVERLKADGRDITLKIFTDTETAAAQAHADNPTLANEFIFDWIASRLEAGAAP